MGSYTQEGSDWPDAGKYHCCATCIHFRAERIDTTEPGEHTSGSHDARGDGERPKVRTYCKRLSYDTRPFYQFNCWHPKERIRKLMRR